MKEAHVAFSPPYGRLLAPFVIKLLPFWQCLKPLRYNTFGAFGSFGIHFDKTIFNL